MSKLSRRPRREEIKALKAKKNTNKDVCANNNATQG
jgi:hypothetical protein